MHWVRAFIRFHGLRHPAELSGAEVEAFLSWLAAERRVAGHAPAGAVGAAVPLSEGARPAPAVDGRDRPPAAPPRLPVVMSRDEVARLLAALAPWPVLQLFDLLYGTGLRLMEGLRLRVKDVDFERRAIVVREGKGGKDRVVMLPAALGAAARAARPRIACGRPITPPASAAYTLPHALVRKYPRAASPGPGSGSSRSPRCRSVRASSRNRRNCSPRSNAATTSASSPSSAPSSVRCTRPASPTSRPRHTRCAIPLRHAPAAVRLRHPHRAGAARPCRRQHHDDLHARAQARRRRGAQPARPAPARARPRRVICRRPPPP